MPRHSLRANLVAAAAAVALAIGLVPAAQPAHAATNIGLNRPVTASGHESVFAPSRASDGDAGPEDPTPSAVHNDPTASRWSAGPDDGVDAWIAVDFGAPASLEAVEIRWGNTYATSYSLEGSADGSDWTELSTGLEGVRGAWTSVTLDESGVRHLRLRIQAKSQTWPLSVWEVRALGSLEVPIEEPISLPVVPRPATAEDSGLGAFTLTPAARISATGEAARTAESFAATLRRSTGFTLPVETTGGDISLVLDPTAELPAEGYTLLSGSDGVQLTAGTEAGLFYGTQSLLQLFGPWARSAEPVDVEWTIQGARSRTPPATSGADSCSTCRGPSSRSRR